MTLSLRGLWRALGALLGHGDPDQSTFVDTRQLTTAHPTRLTDIEQRQQADAEAKIMRVSGKGRPCGQRIPAVMDKRGS